MKVILSRKGFDSSNGGYPSPIFPDGQITSLPIPGSSPSTNIGELCLGRHDLGKMVEELTEGGVRQGRSHFFKMDCFTDKTL